MWLSSKLFSVFSRRSSARCSNKSSSSSGSDCARRSTAASLRESQSSLKSKFRRTVILLIGISLIAACASIEKEIYIARSAKLPEEAKGFLMVADDAPILCAIVGTEGAIGKKNIAGYVVLNPEDLQRLVRNTQELIALREAAEKKK